VCPSARSGVGDRRVAGRTQKGLFNLIRGASTIRRAGVRPKAPIAREGVQSLVEYYFARRTIVPVHQRLRVAHFTPDSVLELTPDLEQRQLKVIRNGLRNSPAFDA
jgi:hypothetical protein